MAARDAEIEQDHAAAAKAAADKLVAVQGRLDEVEDELRRAQLGRSDAEKSLNRAKLKLVSLKSVHNQVKATTEAAMHSIQARIGKVTALEEALLDVYIEFEGRNDDAIDSYETRREQLLEKCNGDALCLMDMFRAMLRVKLTYRDDYENDIEKMVEVADTQADSRLRALADEVSSLTQRLEVAEGARSIAQKKLAQAVNVKDVAVGRANALVEQARAEVLVMHQNLTQANQRATDLKKELDSNVARHEVVVLKGRLVQLENEMKEERHHAKAQATKLTTRHESTVASLRERLSRMTKVTAQNVALQSQVGDLKRQLGVYKRNARVMALEHAERRAERAEELLGKLQKQFDAARKEARQARVTAITKDKRIKAMKVEYNKLFRAVQEAQKQPAPPRLTSSEARDEANKNPHYADYYKKQLVEKDAQIKKLKARIHRLMSHEIQQNGSIRNFQYERSRSQAELGKMRTEMQQMSTTITMLNQDVTDKQEEVKAAHQLKLDAEQAKRRWACGPSAVSRVDPAKAFKPKLLHGSASMPSRVGERPQSAKSPQTESSAPQQPHGITVSSTADVSSTFNVTIGSRQPRRHLAITSASARSLRSVDDSGADALNYAGQPEERRAVQKQKALDKQAARNSAVLQKAAREEERARLARARRRGTAHPEDPMGSASAINPPFTGVSRPLADEEVMQNLVDLDEQQEGIRKLVAKPRPASARRRPLSATSKGSNASRVHIKLSHSALLQNRQTYRPSTDAAASQKRTKQRPASAFARSSSARQLGSRSRSTRSQALRG